MPALVPNALALFRRYVFSGSALQCSCQEFLAGLLLSSPRPMTWPEIVDATFAESPVLGFRLGEALQAMIRNGHVLQRNDHFEATSALQDVFASEIAQHIEVDSHVQ